MTTVVDTLIAIDDSLVMHDFLDDLLTVAEKEEISHRWEIAQLLLWGASYHAIEQETGASSTTIARVAKCVHREGSGYQSAFALV